ncbi:efflux pump periplasmic linker protein [Sphingobium sp. SYK-6]|uniref:efflux RND transporter periplasmic adaptor subunit n=1 Tax=Sphingobium sp. (strain NBRC 103272 / SYK-6) TaxID=627192 RepID=UPI0002276A52|nr:efflux RND transporter periplasmic adaptor subunit [Sphingobium sp. SYK-6]BAK65424.1 efflux pump periplasmic linker protein [Sphingobium sp. SYK-6]
MMISSRPGRCHALFVIASALTLSACSGDAPPPAPPPPDVSVVRVSPTQMAVADELPGRVVAFRVAEIRPQVNGVIQRRLFEQGTEVRAGQPLFQINPAPFRADANSAAAAVQRAQAALARASLQEKRLAPLVKADAVSGQDYDDAVATRDQAAADLAASRADLARRQVDLGFATVRSPISGRIDQAVFTEGALASMTSEQPLATVQQIDRVYVDVRQPAARLEMLREAARAGTAAKGAPVEIVSSDGRALPVKGRLLFSGISVDPSTGEVIARVEVPNADRALLPGMFVRARLPRLAIPDALTVPEQAVQRDPTGKASVSVVGKDGKVAPRPIQTGDTRDGKIIVTGGLKAGETIIVEGQDRVQPGMVVKPQPWRATAPAQR